MSKRSFLFRYNHIIKQYFFIIMLSFGIKFIFLRSLSWSLLNGLFNYDFNIARYACTCMACMCSAPHIRVFAKLDEIYKWNEIYRTDTCNTKSIVIFEFCPYAQIEFNARVIYARDINEKERQQGEELCRK